jgi:hypothetical protein
VTALCTTKAASTFQQMKDFDKRWWNSAMMHPLQDTQDGTGRLNWSLVYIGGPLWPSL